MKVAKGRARMNGAVGVNESPTAAFTQRRIQRATRSVFVYDKELLQDWIRQRQAQRLDRFDEVWKGVYVVPPLPNLPHQGMVGLYNAILHEVVQVPKRGRVFPGANVSDRVENWEENFRCPDIVVVLKGSIARDCATHFCGGPDFLLEIQSPGDETEDKIDFYSALRVRELVIVHRDTRRLRLFRHDGEALRVVEPALYQGENWFLSEALPLAFRRIVKARKPLVEVLRTDGVEGRWVV